MNEYMVYFELYGKKMKKRLTAKNEDDAAYKVRCAIQFYKVEQMPPQMYNDVSEHLKNMFGFK
jgi:hypothetical protein